LAWQKRLVAERGSAGTDSFRALMNTRRAYRVVCCIMLIAPGIAAMAATPFPVADQNPLTRGFYHPLPTAGRLDSLDDGSQFLLTIANTTNMNRGHGERLLVDAESTEFRWLWSNNFDRDWRVRVSLPVVHYGGGFLDPVIDKFHKVFSLPQGSRPNRPDDAFAIEYSAGGHSIAVDSSYTGVGDLSVELGRNLLQQRTIAVSAWSGLELPTGHADRLTGDGAVDAAAWLSADWRPGRNWSVSGSTGMTWQGAGDLLADRSARWVGFQNLTAHWNASDQLYLQAQLDMHDSYVTASHVPLLGAATVLTCGGGYRTQSGWRFGFAVSEDVEVNTSPDVVFQFTIHPPLGPQ
jgi:hypothetical protein